MRHKMLICLSLLSFAAADLFATCKSIRVPMEISKEYAVTVNGTPVEVYREECNDLDRNGGVTVKHTAIFDYMKDAVVQITCKDGFKTYKISPERLQIPSEKSDKSVVFSLVDYYNYTFAIPGKDPLFLFTAPPMDELVSTAQKTASIITYESGVHDIGRLYLKSDTTYVLKKGAMLHGRIYIHNVTNVNVIGRGYIDDRTNAVRGNYIQVYNSTNILLSGFAVRHAEQGWQFDPLNSDNVTVSYLNLLSFGENNDGLDLGVGCRNFRFHDCFIGCGDDGFGWHAINASKDGEEATQFCYAENCLIWKNQVGVGIRIGSSLETRAFSDLHFKNIDMVLEKGPAIAVPHSDWADVSRLTFENIYNESDVPFAVFYIKKTMFSSPKGHRPGTISDVKFINCENKGAGFTGFYGYDKDHMIKDVLFYNVRVNGQYVTENHIKRNQFTSGFKYICEPEHHEIFDMKGYGE